MSELYRYRPEAALLVLAAKIQRYLKFFACLVAARQGVVEVVVWPLLVISSYGLVRYEISTGIPFNIIQPNERY